MATRNSLDYSLLYDNFGELFYLESLDLFLMKGRFLYFVGMFAFVLILVFLEKKKKFLSRWKKPKNYIYNLSFTFVVYITILLSPVLVYENLTYFFQSIYQYHLMDFSSGIDDNNEFPYINEPAINTGNPAQTQQFSNDDLPHIFIVMVESFNARFIEVKNENGIEYTPLFNSLIKKGVFIKNFYSNSIQTAKCKLATLCSIIPSYRGKVYSNHSDLTLHSLADILQEYNYETLYFKAARNLTFDNEGKFAEHIGFNIRQAMTKEFIKNVDQKYNWGWGLQDDQYYIKYFEVLDRLRKENSKNKKFFTVMATISNHARFNRVPEDQLYLYQNPADMEEDYANSIHVSDKYMREFFKQLEKRDYLKNSIVIVLGDHGFPIGEHGNYSNEVGSYEESFRVPFVMLWNGHLKPQYIDKFAYSQMDIAPTILDLLNIKTRNHFMGESFFKDDKNSQHEIYLVQPYDGIHLSVLLHPYKYIKHMRTNREFLYNLEKDPTESVNLIKTIKDKALLNRLRQGLNKIFLNQKLIKENRIWKPSPK
ncbi:MAG: sulfatase-like hydrolase/transferase [Planctomycetes bacterium]|nr:sulfatase-like hydrolase/transferase [Planctomycetota bacterium]